MKCVAKGQHITLADIRQRAPALSNGEVALDILACEVGIHEATLMRRPKPILVLSRKSGVAANIADEKTSHQALEPFLASSQKSTQRLMVIAT